NDRTEPEVSSAVSRGEMRCERATLATAVSEKEGLDEFTRRHRDTLAAAADALSHLELAIDLTLRTTARLVAEPLEAGCVAALIGDDRSSLGLASAWHPNGAERECFEALARAPSPWFVKMVTGAAAKRRPMFIPAVETDGAVFSSAIVAPVVVGGVVLG